MGVLRANVNGEWIDIGTSGGSEEVAISPSDPGFAFDLWYDTDAQGGTPGSGGSAGAPSMDPGNDVSIGSDDGLYFDHDVQYRDHIPKFPSAAARDTAIPAPVEGQQVYLTDVNQFMFWDGTVWTSPSSDPPGAIIMFAGATAPAGWFLCQGQSLVSASYPALFAAIGYTYGGADPNFLLPDLRGRSPVGVGPSGLGNNYALGQKWGEEMHVLSLHEMASHNHDPGTGAANVDHTHGGWTGPLIQSYTNTGIGGIMSGSTLNSWPGHTAGFNTNHVHALTWQGGNGGHQTVHPVLGIQFIIKA